MVTLEVNCQNPAPCFGSQTAYERNSEPRLHIKLEWFYEDLPFIRPYVRGKVHHVQGRPASREERPRVTWRGTPSLNLFSESEAAFAA